MLVMKFGGTSVADAVAIAQVARIVGGVRGRGDASPVVVVSAMSGVTDELLALAAAAARRDDTTPRVDALWLRHLSALRALVPGRRAAEVEADLAVHVADLRALLDSAKILRAVAPAARDAIAAAGELLNSRIVAAALDAAGTPAAWVDARRVVATDEHHGAAAPLPAETATQSAAEILPVARSGRVPVLGGFVGATREGVTTTLGRGGSDFSAALVGAALRALEIQIWTDVDGMLTADPRIVPGARVVPRLSFDEAAELAYFGAKVLHPSTILPAVAEGIPVRILNTRRPDGAGTTITAHADPAAGALTAVACKRRVTTIEMTSTRMLMAYGFLRRVFEVFERCRTPVDVVTTSEVSVSVTIDDAGRLQDIVEALGEIADVRVERDMAIISAVGDRLRQDSRVAARVVAALSDLEIRMVSQAASRRNVTIVVRDADAKRAMTALHEEFFEHEGDSDRTRPHGHAGGLTVS